MTVAVQPIRNRMHSAHVRDIDLAFQQRTITQRKWRNPPATDAVAYAITVMISRRRNWASAMRRKGDVSSPATSQTRRPRRNERRPVISWTAERVHRRAAPGPFTPADLAVQCGRRSVAPTVRARR
jgi:hypothetical protein